MITVAFAKQLHSILIDEYGGAKGLRDIAALEAALAIPFATFDQQDLYFTPLEKAAALLESLIINHPFIDGNKRIAYTLMRYLLLENGQDISSDEQTKYDMVIAASTGVMRYDDILN
ncbi:type II toxin-antitoxin system death-on-curing family toxin [Mucilaginibacter terrae]|uniref:type II toxin-antitoxin system death-on-curing family toxin n=1 Tax=Mucilaginibacter terrae TaxID=1955052 RepID=UPI00363176CD